VPHPDQNLHDASPFQFYLPGILGTADLFARLATWPADIREFSAEPQDILIHRILAHLDLKAIPIQYSAFANLAEDRTRPFSCVISTRETHEFVTRTIAPHRRFWLHISTERTTDVLYVGDVTPADLMNHAGNIVNEMSGDADQRPFFKSARTVLSDSIYGMRTRIDALERRHGVTLPNEIALRAFGFDLTERQQLVPTDTQAYVAASIDSAMLVDQSRRRLLEDRLTPNNEFILTVLSPAWTVRQLEVGRDEEPPGISRKMLNSVLHWILRQQFHFSHVTKDDVMALKEPFVQSIFALRQQETSAYTASLAVHAAHDLTPVLRLEPRLNNVRRHLINIGNCARGNGAHRAFKLRKLVNGLSQDMRASIDSRYLEVLSQQSERIEGLSLVTDLPLELLPIKGIPLGLAFDTSRIPVNPGNLSFGELLVHRTVEVPYRRFSDVLIVRSFSRGDRSRYILENSIAAFSRADEDMPNIQIVDVESADEFIRVVNRYTGAVLIFDGHGSHNSVDQTSPIIVGGQPMDVWAYRRELKLPPIVMLSACDTLPLDGSHGSSAAGFLSAGAMTVLGTTLPIHCATAGAFIARLLFRITQFMPKVVLFSKRPLEWRGFLAGLLRMTHVSELVQEQMTRFKLPEETFEEIQMVANMQINLRNPTWHESVARRMQELFPASWVAELKGSHPLQPITDSLKYVQLGHPELIQIVPDPPDLSEARP
jgi:hypothetical protein